MYQPKLSEQMLPKPDRASSDNAFHDSNKGELFRLDQWRLENVREHLLQHQQKLQQLQQQKIVEEQMIVIDAATCLQIMKHDERREKLHAAKLKSLCTKRLCQMINLPFDYGKSKFEADIRRQKRLRSKQQNLRAQQEAIEQAKPAAKLLKGIMKDPEKRKILLIRMALVREKPRSTPETWPAKGSVIPSDFCWKNYPPLVAVLQESMEQYYNLSTNCTQLPSQVDFIDRLEDMVQEAANEHGWTFHLSCFSDSYLRTRIRCYYKCHIQNSKKRILSLLANPTKAGNIKRLNELSALIFEVEKWHQKKQNQAS